MMASTANKSLQGFFPLSLVSHFAQADLSGNKIRCWWLSFLWWIYLDGGWNCTETRWGKSKYLRRQDAKIFYWHYTPRHKDDPFTSSHERNVIRSGVFASGVKSHPLLWNPNTFYLVSDCTLSANKGFQLKKKKKYWKSVHNGCARLIYTLQ